MIPGSDSQGNKLDRQGQSVRRLSEARVQGGLVSLMADGSAYSSTKILVCEGQKCLGWDALRSLRKVIRKQKKGERRREAKPVGH
ncbi:hypothetical protein NEUTE2DRAFT_158818 [Neurospora tetrasperma FGSC 2509]|nr:hypothetical protein NEUTE2DRAFT_158818 [Neurospora tetrasperma FGSC 2509]